MGLLPLIFSLVFAYFAIKLVRIALKLRSNWIAGEKIPGPPAIPIIGNVLDVSLPNSELYDFFVRASQKMRAEGHKIFRLHIMDKLYVFPLDGETIAPILDSKSELNKGDDYDFFIPWLGGGLLLEGATDRWRSHRKLLTPTFHFAKLEGYLEVFNNESKILVDVLADASRSGETIDFFVYIKKCALDIICGAAMGKTVNAQLDAEHSYVKSTQGFNRMGLKYAFNPLMWNSLIFWLMGYKKEKEEYLKTMKTFVNGVIAERREELASGLLEQETSKRKMNFLDMLLSMEGSEELTAEDLRQEVETFMFAGHDTTSGSVSWAIWALAHHQDIQEKVYEELKEIIGDSPEVTLEHINKLNYFEKVLKESKRFVAPVPIVSRKLAGDMELGGYNVPGGTIITISPMMLHSNQNVYKNPEKFDPERFSAENISKRHPYDFIPFSAGLRNCIGQRFAQMNERVILSHILLNFKIDPAPGVAHSDIKKCPEAITVPDKGIPVRLTRRH